MVVLPALRLRLGRIIATRSPDFQVKLNTGFKAPNKAPLYAIRWLDSKKAFHCEGEISNPSYVIRLIMVKVC